VKANVINQLLWSTSRLTNTKMHNVASKREIQAIVKQQQSLSIRA